MKLGLALILVVISFDSASAGEKFACRLNALSKAERSRHRELTQALAKAVQEKTELESGYAFRLPPATLMTAAEWMSYERRCCPFFALAIEQARDDGPLWLRITGADGVKAFIRSELDL